MSKLDDLLQGVEVEFKTLSEISNIGTGNSNRQDEAEKGIYPFFVRSKNILKSNTYQFDEEAIIIPGEGGIGDIFHYVLGKYALHQRAYRININNKYIITKYIYYIMLNNFKQYIIKKSIGATATSIRKPMLEKFQIPIPCPDNQEKSLEIQQEIVRILDQLTETTNNLKTELENERQIRKKQFEFYREELLSFEGKDMKLVKLGELCKIASGKNKGRSDNGKYALYGSTGIIGKTNVKKFDSERILVARVGANAGFAYIVNGEYDVSDNALVIDKCDNILTKYLFYYLFNMNLNQFAKGAGQPLITGTFLKNLIIPIPTLEEQERIVNLLDQFDTAHTAIEEEITKEIKLRTQQYEYYREKLLTFPKN